MEKFINMTLFYCTQDDLEIKKYSLGTFPEPDKHTVHIHIAKVHVVV